MQDKIELENKVMNFLKELIITNTYVKKIIIDNIQEDILNFFKKIKPEETTVQLSKNNIDKNIYFKNGIVIINTFNINIKNYDEYSNSASLYEKLTDIFINEYKNISDNIGIYDSKISKLMSENDFILEFDMEKYNENIFNNIKFTNKNKIKIKVNNIKKERDIVDQMVRQDCNLEFTLIINLKIEKYITEFFNNYILNIVNNYHKENNKYRILRSEITNNYDREGEEQNILRILHSQIKNLEDNMFIGETESLSVIKEAILKYTNDFFTKLEHLFAIENTFKYYVKNKDKIFKQELINLLP